MPKHAKLPSHLKTAFQPGAAVVETVITFKIPSSDLAMIHVDGVAVPMHKGEGRCFLSPGTHVLIWGGYGPPDTPYTLAITAPAQAAWTPDYRTDEHGHAGGLHQFTV